MYCRNCGVINDDSALYCVECGSLLAAEPSQPDAVPQAQASSQTSDDMPQTQSLPQGYTVMVDGVQGAANPYATAANTTAAAPGMNPAVPNHTAYDSAVVTRKSRALIAALAILSLVAVIALVLVLVDPLDVIWHRGGSNNSGGTPSGGSTNGVVVVSGIPPKDNPTGSEGASGSVTVSDTTASDEGDDRIQQGKSSIVGNLVNGGHMAVGEDGYVYYASPVDGTDWDTRSIVRCSPDGSGKTTVYAGPSSTRNLYHISVIGDRIVFNQVIEKGSTVVSVRTDGGDKITLDSCDDWSLCQVDDGWVYYLKSGRVCRCDLAGKVRETFASVGGNTLWRVAGKRLFTFTEKGAREVYVSDLNGSNRSVVFSSANGYEVKNAFPIDQDALLVWEAPSSGEGARLSRVDVASSNTKAFWTSGNKIERVCAYASGAIITKANSGGAYSLATIPYDTGGIDIDVVVSQGTQTRYTCCLGDRIYYGNVDESAGLKCSVWSIALSGYDARQIS